MALSFLIILLCSFIIPCIRATCSAYLIFLDMLSPSFSIRYWKRIVQPKGLATSQEVICMT
jgi:hypothetical protein